jgi:hypothetical protein
LFERCISYAPIVAVSASEDAKLPLKNEEQLLDVAMFLAQDVNDHCALPKDRVFEMIADIACEILR